MNWLPHGYGGNRRSPEEIKREGWVEQGKPVFWYSLDFKRLSIPLSEVAERIVAAMQRVLAETT